MSSSDIQSKRITGTGSLGVGPARITQIQVLTTSGSPRITVENGNGGQTVLDLDFSASSTHSVNIPDDGIRCSDDVYVSAFTACTAATVFYR
jgi:hypothetical protein